MDLHKAVCLLHGYFMLYMVLFFLKESKAVVWWSLIVLHVIRAVVSCLSARLQEVIMKPSLCLPCSILQAQSKTGT